MSLRGFERVSSRASQVNDDVNIKLRVSESSLLFSPDASAAIGNPAYAVILLNSVLILLRLFRLIRVMMMLSGSRKRLVRVSVLHCRRF